MLKQRLPGHAAVVGAKNPAIRRAHIIDLVALPATPTTAVTRPPEIAGPISRKLTLLRTSMGSRVRPSSSARCAMAARTGMMPVVWSFDGGVAGLSRSGGMFGFSRALHRSGGVLREGGCAHAEEQQESGSTTMEQGHGSLSIRSQAILGVLDFTAVPVEAPAFRPERGTIFTSLALALARGKSRISRLPDFTGLKAGASTFCDSRPASGHRERRCRSRNRRLARLRELRIQRRQVLGQQFIPLT